MKSVISGRFLALFYVLFYAKSFGQAEWVSGIDSLTVWQHLEPVRSDWLLGLPKKKAEIYKRKDGKDIILYNGLVMRRFRIKPNVA